MARYFFNTADQQNAPDQVGTELGDHAAARRYAIVFAGQVMHSEPEVLWGSRDFNVEVTDEAGLLLFTLTAYVANAQAGGDTK